MDILPALMRRLLASVGAIGSVVRYVSDLVLHLILLDERRRAERLRNESAEIQNIYAYEKLLAHHARILLRLGHTPNEVSAVISTLMLRRVRAYLALNAMADLDQRESKLIANKTERVSVDRPSERRLRDRRQSLARRRT